MLYELTANFLCLPFSAGQVVESRFGLSELSAICSSIKYGATSAFICSQVSARSLVVMVFTSSEGNIRLSDSCYMLS